ncbi:hypothetical protein BOTBODRAFT_59875 [Botryobasidium botryosum FD-172 SS1]|uniref:Protein kinase domain-containing protein n=1 Tax=Botryobasidium botryosum (strain FD-172 SS1) TaxID=930990 RepID=A0A067M7J7_BOTB1|nr:hypothetical protein BOTBODRAFT_59875 [Botryobasidium botryosum FD-172 SS1]
MGGCCPGRSKPSCAPDITIQPEIIAIPARQANSHPRHSSGASRPHLSPSLALNPPDGTLPSPYPGSASSLPAAAPHEPPPNNPVYQDDGPVTAAPSLPPPEPTGANVDPTPLPHTEPPIEPPAETDLAELVALSNAARAADEEGEIAPAPAATTEPDDDSPTPHGTTSGSHSPLGETQDTRQSVARTSTYTSDAPSIGTRSSSSLLIVPFISTQIEVDIAAPVAEGGFGVLYCGQMAGKGKVALKRLRATDQNALIRRFEREIKIWSMLEHPHVLKFFGVCCIERVPHMISPWMENGSLLDYFKKENTAADRLQILFQTALALAYLHEQQPPIVHGDLKAANILISNDGRALLCDFGLTTIAEVPEFQVATGSNFAGTPIYMAPELLAGTVTRKTPASDVYAYGILIAMLLSSRDKEPFKSGRPSAGIMGLVTRAVAHGFRPLRPSTVPFEVWAIAETCWKHDPLHRPSMNQVSTAEPYIPYSRKPHALIQPTPDTAPETCYILELPPQLVLRTPIAAEFSKCKRRHFDREVFAGKSGKERFKLELLVISKEPERQQTQVRDRC